MQEQIGQQRANDTTLRGIGVKLRIPHFDLLPRVSFEHFQRGLT